MHIHSRTPALHIAADRRNSGQKFWEQLETPIGTIFLVSHADCLVGIDFEPPKDVALKKSGHSTPAKVQISEYFTKGRRKFGCKTQFTTGTDFERTVWKALNAIPYGETRTYKWLSESIGKPAAFRAVGRALGKNPIPIIFPCHRVIESDGSLGGYSPGAEIKRRLLELEYYQGRQNL